MRRVSCYGPYDLGSVYGCKRYVTVCENVLNE
jgi:hypothetical protein